MKRTILILAFLLALVPAAAAADAADDLSARSYQIRFKKLPDAVDLISDLLSEEGSVSMQPRLKRLVVQDRLDVLDRIGAVLDDFDQPPVNVDVTVSLFLGSDSRDEEAGRHANTGSISREVRGITETLGDFTKWTAYDTIGSRSVTCVRGQPGDGEPVRRLPCGVLRGCGGGEARARSSSSDFPCRRSSGPPTRNRTIEDLYTPGMRPAHRPAARGGGGAGAGLDRGAVPHPQGAGEVARCPNSTAGWPPPAARSSNGTTSPTSEESLRRELEETGLIGPGDEAAQPASRTDHGPFRIRSRVSSREFLIFNQELSALVSAGLPIVPSLDILLERRKNEAFRRALLDIRDRVKSGEALSDAFAAQGDLFPPLYCASLASGERSGEMAGRAEALHRVHAERHDGEAEGRLGADLPGDPARPVHRPDRSDGLLHHPEVQRVPGRFRHRAAADHTGAVRGSPISGTELADPAGAGAGAMIGGTVWQRTPAGRMFFHSLQLRMPVVGGILSDYAQNRFTRTLGTLQSGGIPLVTSLELAARAVGNAVFETRI